MMQLILLILNILDYIFTLINRDNPFFEEGNPLAGMILDNTVLLTVIKLVIVPVFIYFLWRNKDLKITKIGTIVLCILYVYAVVLGILYVWR